MATTSLQYATHAELKELVPYISSVGDSKIPIYNWSATGTGSTQYSAKNSGLVTQLYANGEELGDKKTNIDKYERLRK